MARRLIKDKKLVHGLIIGISGAVLALSLWGLGWLDIWESKTWDLRALIMAKPGKATDNIRLILLDQNSLDWAKNENGWNWPWPREIYSAILIIVSETGLKPSLSTCFLLNPLFTVSRMTLPWAGLFPSLDILQVLFLWGKKAGSDTKWPAEIPRLSSTLSDWING